MLKEHALRIREKYKNKTERIAKYILKLHHLSEDLMKKKSINKKEPFEKQFKDFLEKLNK